MQVRHAAARSLHRVRLWYWRLVRPLTLGVSGIVLDQQGRVILIRNSYRDGWHLPGGGVKRGETVAAAMLRELDEETGYRAQSPLLRTFGVFAHFSEGNYDHVVVFVIRDAICEIDRGASFEIEAVGAFDLNNLPPDIGPATLRRLREFETGAAPDSMW